MQVSTMGKYPFRFGGKEYDHVNYTIFLKYTIMNETKRSLAERLRSFAENIRPFFESYTILRHFDSDKIETMRSLLLKANNDRTLSV